MNSKQISSILFGKNIFATWRKETILEDMRKCARCDLFKHVSNFCKDNRRSCGLSSYCRPCQYELNKISQQKRKDDPIQKMTRSCRHAVYRSFKAIGEEKDVECLKLLGLTTYLELKEYIESLFYPHPESQEQMTFENYGKKGWQIDHIIPLCSDRTIEGVKKLNHFTNLQPLWAEDHARKTQQDIKKYSHK
jgi:hypothetical protein